MEREGQQQHDSLADFTLPCRSRSCFSQLRATEAAVMEREQLLAEAKVTMAHAANMDCPSACWP